MAFTNPPPLNVDINQAMEAVCGRDSLPSPRKRDLFDDFVSANGPPPAFCEEIGIKTRTFINEQSRERPVALVTGGGTTVPLEMNTVRSINNFSTGGRGARSVEHFLAAGYAVIHLGSLDGQRAFDNRVRADPLQHLALSQDGSVSVNPAHTDRLRTILQLRDHTRANNLLLEVPFLTVHSYLYLLFTIAAEIRPLGRRALVFLSAAVSDFYIPRKNLPQHKISSSTDLTLHLLPVPKLLYALRVWAPDAFIVSFKLETDPDLLLTKAMASLKTAGHSLCVANLLATHDHIVQLVAPSGPIAVLDSSGGGKELEEMLVERLKGEHELKSPT